MTDYSEPLANMPALLSRLTVMLNERRHMQALRDAIEIRRRADGVIDWLIAELTRGGDEE